MITVVKFRAKQPTGSRYISPWGWYFLSLPLLLLCNDLNMVKITFLYLLFVNTAFEGYKWPWIENSFQHLKLLH